MNGDRLRLRVRGAATLAAAVAVVLVVVLLGTEPQVDFGARRIEKVPGRPVQTDRAEPDFKRFQVISFAETHGSVFRSGWCRRQAVQF